MTPLQQNCEVPAYTTTSSTQEVDMDLCELCEERDELELKNKSVIKIFKKLTSMKKLGEHQKRLLYEQKGGMIAYLNSVNARIIYWGL